MSESATSVMQKPAGTVIPPLTRLHAWPAASEDAANAAAIGSRAMVRRAIERRMSMPLKFVVAGHRVPVQGR